MQAGRPVEMTQPEKFYLTTICCYSLRQSESSFVSPSTDMTQRDDDDVKVGIRRRAASH